MPLTVATYPTAAEAARALAGTRSARFLGGGTVLMRAVNEASAEFDTLVRTTDPALRTVRAEGGEIVIGAAVTMAALVRDVPVLAPVARLVGGPQVRNAATLAGNLFAEPPYGDLAAALLALGATLETADGGRVRIDDFRADPRTLVIAVRIPATRDLHFAKVTRVKPKGVSVLSIAALLPRRAGRLDGVRIAFNGMGERPVRAAAAERALEGQPLGAAAIARAAAAAADGLTPQDDALASAWYRREVAGVHLRRLLEGIR